MSNDNIINKQLLLNHFAGNSTPLQKKLIEEWLTFKENMELYYEWLDEWENDNAQFVVDDKKAFQKIFAEKDEVKIESNIPIRFLYKKLAVAAVVIFLISCSFLLAKETIYNKTIDSAYGEVKLVILPDGSTVTLNANSSIKYSRFSFGDINREVYLNGEADFSVIHTKSNQKFIVKTKNKLDVTVLGTQFSVYSRNANDKVVLRRGKVSLKYNENLIAKNLILKPGDEFTKNKSGNDKVEHINNTEKEVAWKNHDFLFEGTSLADIAEMLNDDFGVTAHFDNESLADRKISGSFHAEKAEDLIDAISQLLDLNYKTKTNNVYFFE